MGLYTRNGVVKAYIIAKLRSVIKGVAGLMRDPEEDVMHPPHENPLTTEFGPCPHCATTNSRIVWGWRGVYYDMRCACGHAWVYEFGKSMKK